MSQGFKAGTNRVLVMANCTHYSLALALRQSGLFSNVRSAELYSMNDAGRERLAEELGQFDFILTLEHGERFGPLATAALRQRFADKLFSLPTPFFSGLMPDMAYLQYGDEIARSSAVLGDYHSALVLEDVRSGFSKEAVVQRYVSGKAFDRLDVEGVWADGLAELKEREKTTDIALSDYIEQAAAAGTIAGQFLSFNHPTEGLINHVARAFINRLGGTPDKTDFVSREAHNLYADAFWPLHPAVAERLKLPQPESTVYKQPDRLGGARMEMAEFVRRSVDFFTEDHEVEKFGIVTPSFLASRIASVSPASVETEETALSVPAATTIGAPAVHAGAPKKIVMTHFGRSGSTVLAELLKQHSRIAWLDEFFSLKWINSRETYNFTLQQLLDMIATQTAKRRAQNPDLLVGHEIKLMNFLQNPSCNMVDYARATADPSEYIHIVLRRRNILKRICSVYKAAQTNVYHVKSTASDDADRRFTVNFDNLIDYDTGQRGATLPELISKAVAREESVLENYRKVGVTYLELSYEDDIETDPLQAYRKIIDYLGLDFEPAQVGLKKTGRGLRSDIKNYDQVEAALAASEYAWMLQ